MYPIVLLFTMSVILVGLTISLDVFGIAGRKTLTSLSLVTVLYQLLFCYVLYNLGGKVNVLGLNLSIDNLSFLVIVTVCIVGLSCIIASYRYLEIYEGKSSLPYYGLTTLFIYTMTVIPMVRDWLSFLFVWEIMTLSSYFLIIYEYYDDEARRVGWKYFVTMHSLNTSPLIMAIALYYSLANGFEFKTLGSDHVVTGAILVLFLIGFATKAGLLPMHFWLPEAHPIAPSPISGLLSGVMVELGVYGMLRVLQMFTYAPSYVLLLVLILSLLSIVLVLFMYGVQSDIKRLFAWSTIDNMGWMFLIVASYLLGMSRADIALGLYILCHGLVKAAAFLSAGNLIYVFNTRDLTKLKGAINNNKLAIGLAISSILFLEGVPPSNLFLCKLDVIKRTMVFNPWIGLIILIEWIGAFVIFLHIIHAYLMAHGKPKTVRSNSMSMCSSIVFLLALSIIIYPLIVMILR